MVPSRKNVDALQRGIVHLVWCNNHMVPGAGGV